MAEQPRPAEEEESAAEHERKMREMPVAKPVNRSENDPDAPVEE